jgi:hypothetical protein
MRIESFSWSRYRSFKDRQRVEVSPLTVIIGRNGSGKSVVSRLPVLLASGVAIDATDPLDLESGGIEHAATYQDLAYQRGRLPFSLGASVAGEHGSYEFETTLRYVTETRSIVVEKFLLLAGNELLLSLELADEAQFTSAAPIFKASGLDASERLQVEFAGLLPKPDLFKDGARRMVERALMAIRAAFPAPSYLGPFRVEASRSNSASGRTVRELGARGQRAIELLAEDAVRFNGRLVEEVSNWFVSAVGQGIAVEFAADLARVLVKDPRHAIDVSLADTGAGLAQVLPFVVQHLATKSGRLLSKMLIVEQPELHLHPGAHGAVMDLALSSVLSENRPTGITCLIETHSEQMIMRLRRRIAEGVDPSKVAIWSLNHSDVNGPDEDVEPLRIIGFDQDGSPDSWPAGVFEESFQDLKALAKAARER